MSDLSPALRAHARQLLASGRVDYVIGYETGSDGRNARPFFAYSAAEAERLVFDNTCTHNLAKYVAERERRGHRIGVVVKPCDSRSLVVLLREKQFPRDVVAIGVVCPGVVQRTREGGDGQTLQTRCQACGERTPVACDIVVGEPTPPLPAGEECGRLATVADLSEAERAAFWGRQFARCLRCYACRQACPQCYCSECFVESLDPEWVGIRIDQPESWLFHTIRTMHLAGRCVGCDECERVCPVRIPLGLPSAKLRQEVLAKFGFRAGQDPNQPPPLETFRPDERLGAP